MQRAPEVLREEIRSLGVEKALSGYVATCCMEDIAQDEMQEMLTGRVLRTVMERLKGQYDWDNTDLLFVLAEESYRIVQTLEGRDMAKLGKAMEFVTMATTDRPN
jgi:hypothetical protein